jgi:hypothetical protein
MAQNRPPPAYQEYAASMLANNDFRMMDLAARGLLYTLRLEYWIGNPLPSDSLKLAKILRLDPDSVAIALREIGDLICITDGMINIPELEDYRQHLSGVRKKQSIGGKEGAAIARRNAASRRSPPQPVDDQVGNHEVSHGSTTGSLVKHRSVKSNIDKSNSVINEEDEWLADYDKSDVHGYGIAGTRELKKLSNRQ